MITQEIMERFFRNECTSEEKDRITLYLQEHPEELDKWLNEEEWENFEAAGDLPAFVSEKLFGRISEEQRKDRLPKILFRRLAAAACIALAIVAGWKFYPHRRQVSPSMTANRVASVDADTLQYARNNSGDKMTVALKDGSLIELYPESEVSFSERADAPERVVYLKGKAYFKVVKNKDKPFKVYSDEIATSVLGTSFTVTSFERDNTIKVNLHDGKVLIKAADPKLLKLPGDLYLAPGDLLVYVKKCKKAMIHTPRIASRSARIKGTSAAPPEWYMFKGQTLDQVFDQLGLYYGVDIDYFPSDIRNRYFTGRYDNTDTLEGILKDISLLNGLSIDKQDKSYIVRKKAN
jgi:transmembrane sensor